MNEQELNPPEVDEDFQFMSKELASFIGMDFRLNSVHEREMVYKAVHPGLINMTYAEWAIPCPECFSKKDGMPHVINFNELATFDGAVLKLKNLAGNTVAEWSREYERTCDHDDNLHDDLLVDAG